VESFGIWGSGNDPELFPLITSVNLACGFHAGDPLTMHRSVSLAARHGLRIGAHPGYRDLVGFGRRHMQVAPERLEQDVLYQLGALHAFVRAQGLALSHVKAHGALYSRMATDAATARAVAAAV